MIRALTALQASVVHKFLTASVSLVHVVARWSLFHDCRRLLWWKISDCRLLHRKYNLFLLWY